jgi:hypothetical protein
MKSIRRLRGLAVRVFQRKAPICGGFSGLRDMYAMTSPQEGDFWTLDAAGGAFSPPRMMNLDWVLRLGSREPGWLGLAASSPAGSSSCWDESPSRMALLILSPHSTSSNTCPILTNNLHALGRLLVPDGRLVVTVPDAGSWMATLSGRRWNMYLLEHLWFFDESTLTAFMARAGFRQTCSRKVSYDASLAHIMRRLAQTFAPAAAPFGRALPEIILPVPAGVMYGVFERHLSVE